VLPDMIPALTLLSASATQWRHAGMTGVPTGLDYAGVEAAARMAGLQPTPDVFRDLRHLEAGIIEALAEGADR
jgi:hypothetical protein